MRCYYAEFWDCWMIYGEPLPPPQRGTHWCDTKFEAPKPYKQTSIEDDAGFRWSRCLDD